MSRGEIVALANFQAAFLFGLGNGKAGDLQAVMLQNISLDFGICGRYLCCDGVRFFGAISISMWVSASLDKHTIVSTVVPLGREST